MKPFRKGKLQHYFEIGEIKEESESLSPGVTLTDDLVRSEPTQIQM